MEEQNWTMFDGTINQDSRTRIPRMCLNCEHFMDSRIRVDYWDGDGMCCAERQKNAVKWCHQNDIACDMYKQKDMPEDELLWLSAFSFNPSKIPWLVIEKNGVRLYRTQEWYIGQDNRDQKSVLVYHVRTKDEWLSTEHYRDAYKVWNNLASGGRAI